MPEDGAVNAFTEVVGCRIPLQQAGMGGVVTPALAGAVALEGGLGMLSGTGLDPDAMARHVAEATHAAGADGRIGVTFLMPFLDRDAYEAAASMLPVVECFYDDPDAALVDIAHGGGALAAWQVGSVEEAKQAVDAGCDFVVVQGVEAGGHIRKGALPLLPLVLEVRNAVAVPIVAAGGIGTGRDIAEAMDAGADAVRVGTRFLAAAEADVHPDYAAALARATAEDTVVTEGFSMFWPDAPHRVLRHCLEASDDDPMTRSPMPPARDFAGDVASSAMYAGTSVSGVKGVQPAAEIVRELLAEAAEAAAQRG